MVEGRHSGSNSWAHVLIHKREAERVLTQNGLLKPLSPTPVTYFLQRGPISSFSPNGHQLETKYAKHEPMGSILILTTTENVFGKSADTEYLKLPVALWPHPLEAVTWNLGESFPLLTLALRIQIGLTWQNLELCGVPGSHPCQWFLCRINYKPTSRTRITLLFTFEFWQSLTYR